MIIYKKGTLSTYAMYLEIDEYHTNMNNIIPENWRQSSSIHNSDLTTSGFKKAACYYAENDNKVNVYISSTPFTNELETNRTNANHVWLARNVDEWVTGTTWLCRSGAVTEGYFFAKESSIPERSRLCETEWSKLRNQLGLNDAIQSPDEKLAAIFNSQKKATLNWNCTTCKHTYDVSLDLCPQCHTPKTKSVAMTPPIERAARNTKYDREIIGLDGTKVMVDVYRVLDAFPTTNPQLQHISKKSLAAGLRGHKTTLQDLIDIRDSAISAIVAHKQKEDLEFNG